MAEIRLHQLVKRFDNGVEAVKSTDLTIADGEFLVLVGPSGCGKSTTLRMIAGLEEATAGDIFIGDRRVNDIDPGKRDIAMVFQNYALYPHMTVRQNMSFGLKMRKTPKAEIQRRVGAAAEILSIESLLDRRPSELSGGQRQRVAVGRAIVRQPAAFLFDEPLSNLDAKLRVQMRTELAKLHQQLKTTTIYVTHDQVEAMTLGDRIVVMNEGVIQQVDSPMDIYRQPANRFVAGFIGSPAMNFVSGTVQQEKFLAGPIAYRLGSGPRSHQGPAVLGFRPEHVTTNPADPHLADVTLDVVERMGHETNVYFGLADNPMVVRLEGEVACQPGHKLSLYLPENRWHLFDVGEPGTRIAP